METFAETVKLDECWEISLEVTLAATAATPPATDDLVTREAYYRQRLAESPLTKALEAVGIENIYASAK